MLPQTCGNNGGHKLAYQSPEFIFLEFSFSL